MPIRHIVRRFRVKMDTVNRDRALQLLVGFFGSTKKAELWMKSRNPLLGGVTPEFMISHGRSNRLLKFMRHCMDGNVI